MVRIQYLKIIREAPSDIDSEVTKLISKISKKLIHSIINNRPFFDGNKRISLFNAVLFLTYNQKEITFKRKEAVKFTKRVQDEDYTVEQISKWLKAHSN